MIYAVDQLLDGTQSDAEWAQWEATMKPASIFVTVPGIRTAQRFKGLASPPPYLALYSIDSLDVMSSDAYKNMGGGTYTPVKWKSAIKIWERNVFDGIDLAPLVPMGSYLLVIDEKDPRIEAALPGLVWLRSVGLNRSIPDRAMIVVDQNGAQRWIDHPTPQVKVFAPLAPALLSA